MQSLKLIPIDQSGNPAEAVSPLSDVAKQVCEATIKVYEKTGYAPPWLGYLTEIEGEVVGTCAFKTPPNGRKVEIVYYTFPGFEGHGYATAMARELIAIAQAAQPNIMVMAQTKPEMNASTSILKKLGFKLAGTVKTEEDGAVWGMVPGWLTHLVSGITIS